ncbi:MAG: branched-chain amino acid aminotransferase [Exilispira sp.]|jgi:branched-chain amino acid aminotransferase|nr:branched-chain amino acid aminotransferase [Exilispira sp.]
MIKEKMNLDWKNLKFSYIKTDYRYISFYKNGSWDQGYLSESNEININEGSPVLHYGQGAFEGLKAFTQKNGDIGIFRPQMNSKRLNLSAKRLLMPLVLEEKFIDALCKVVKSNYRWIPPYGVDASFYLRPYEIGIGENLGVKPANEYLFSVFGVPVGPYFKDGFKPVSMIVSELDRAAPKGTGNVKVGGNYAASLLPHEKAVEEGYSDCIYLDPKENRYIEEAGAANFFGITKDGRFLTPKSDSILESITRLSLMQIAEDQLGLKVEETRIPIDTLDEFVEVGACGTAAVITPIGKIRYKDKEFIFYDNGKKAGPITTELYNILLSIQRGEVEDKYNWIHIVR